MVTSHTHLAVVWCVEDVNSAGFDSVGLGPPVQSEAALPPPPVSTGERTIVPRECKHITFNSLDSTLNKLHAKCFSPI
jgi:hypothetical protein